MIEIRWLKNVVIFIQTVLSFVLSRKIKGKQLNKENIAQKINEDDMSIALFYHIMAYKENILLTS